MTAAKDNSLICAVFGSPDFCRRMNSIISGSRQCKKILSGSIAEGWSLLVTARPHLVFIEIGVQHNDRAQALTRKLLAQARERFTDEICVCVVLNSPEKLAYGGDLLFENDSSLKPSGYIDTFLATPPGNFPSIPSLREQVVNVLELYYAEFQRRSENKIPLPALNSGGWVSSLADTQSRELWMRWLPRYASYTNENPIIIGETGTGKTNLAYALHLLSGRKGEFVAITPRDFSSSELIQAELFGAVAGAYTGAVDKWGLVKRAEKGTLFIDELQSIDKDLQGKLITFIENKIYRRVGSAESVSADVRFVFASNRTLYDMMSSGVLRDDFAYRLERVQLELTPLNQRRLDIVAGLAFALAKIQRLRPHALPTMGCSSTAYRILFGQLWPGNLRQLENTSAKLCEYSDLRGQNVIDENSVMQALGTKFSGSISTASEVIAIAAHQLFSLSLKSGLHSLNDGIQRFVEITRTTALEASAGDVERAASLIQDSVKLMELNSRSILAKKELKSAE